MMISRVLAFAFLVLLAACDGTEDLTPAEISALEARAGVSDTPPLGEGDLVAYVGATLIDGTGADPVENAIVLAQGQKIVGAGTGIDIPADAEIVRADGKWIVPGLIDAHIHFMTSGRLYTRPAFIDMTHIVPYAEEVEWIKGRVPVTLRSILCSGVTSVVSMGGPKIEYVARDTAKTMADAPTVFNSHGVLAPIPEFLAKNFFDPWDGELAVKPMTTQKQAIRHVADAVMNDAVLIKTAVDGSGGMLQRFMIRNYPSIHEALIETAAKHGLRVTSHIHELEPGRKLMELGVASLQHIPADALVDEGFIALAKEKDVIIVPTLALRTRSFVEIFGPKFDLLPVEKSCGDPEVIKSWFESGEMPPLQEARHADHEEKTKRAHANTKALYESGVTLAVAADAGLMGLLLGPSMHLELQAMNDAGIPPKDLIVAATLNGAKVAGKEAFYGSIEPGKFADFLVLSANPLDDIGNMQAIDLVVKHGQAFAQDELLPLPATP